MHDLAGPGARSWLRATPCEALGFAAGGAALHVDDLPVAEREDLEALVPSSIRSKPLGRTDDLVVVDLGELGPDLDALFAALLDLELQDLKGLVGAVTRGSVASTTGARAKRRATRSRRRSARRRARGRPG